MKSKVETVLVKVIPDFSRVQLVENDKYIILTSGGAVDGVFSGQVVHVKHALYNKNLGNFSIVWDRTEFHVSPASTEVTLSND